MLSRPCVVETAVVNTGSCVPQASALYVIGHLCCHLLRHNLPRPVGARHLSYPCTRIEGTRRERLE
jgi:hypothetical protein